MVCVVGRMRDLILQLSKSSIYSTKPFSMSGNGDQSVTIPNGEYRYEIGEYLRGGPFIQVWKGSKFITEIKLNGANFENNIEQYINN